MGLHSPDPGIIPGSPRATAADPLTSAADPLTSRNIASVIAMALLSGCIPTLQPILLGGLLTAHRISAPQVGQAAACEALGIALSTAAAGAFLKPNNLRLIAACAAIVMAAANSFTTLASSAGVLFARGMNGVGSGIITWLMIGMLVRVKVPGRITGYYFTLLSLTSFVLSLFFSRVIVPRLGISASYAVLALLSLSLLCIVAWLPRSYSQTTGVKGRRWPTPIGALGLAASSSYLAGIMAFWVYLEPVARSRGYSVQLTDSAISAAIGVQILGSLAASLVANRITSPAATLSSAAACAAAILLVISGATAGVFFVAILVFAFFWMFAPVFHVPMLIKFDPSLRSVMFIDTVQCIGITLGPALASVMVGAQRFSQAGITGVTLLSACCAFTVAGLLVSEMRPALPAA